MWSAPREVDHAPTRLSRQFEVSVTPVPGLVYGTAWKAEQTESLVAAALRQGFRALDTACQPKHYNEGGVGAGITQVLGDLRRGELYLQSKFTPLAGQDPERIPYDSQAPLDEQVRQSLGVSLENLRTSYLDCLLLHSPLATFDDTLIAWRAMQRLAAAGKVRQLGLSNCYDYEYLVALYDSVDVKPSVLQNRFHGVTGYDHRIRQFCRRRGIIYQAFWILTANKHILANETIERLSRVYHCEPPQILYRYLTQRSVVPVIGPRSIAHMIVDLAIFAFELTSEDCRQVDLLLHRVREESDS